LFFLCLSEPCYPYQLDSILFDVVILLQPRGRQELECSTLPPPVPPPWLASPLTRRLSAATAPRWPGRAALAPRRAPCPGSCRSPRRTLRTRRRGSGAHAGSYHLVCGSADLVGRGSCHGASAGGRRGTAEVSRSEASERASRQRLGRDEEDNVRGKFVHSPNL